MHVHGDRHRAGSELQWSEEASAAFLERGEVFTPARKEIAETILELLPVEPDEDFLVVDIGSGPGWLSAAILERFPQARVIALDGSATMLQEAVRRLDRFGSRVEFREFRLEDAGWLDVLPGVPRAFVSSLVIHHLDDEGKQALYQKIHERLEGPGALLIADLVAPRSERERRYMGSTYDRLVRQQSLELTGSLETYDHFVESEWNWFQHPDRMDMPSSIPEHLTWLAEAGFRAANVFWQRAGHAIYGGYKETV